ncbi:MAG TPA: CbtB-domain containing protein [Aestuariivirga sp.]|jgi:cobalt transporter subunit CbtB|nr:CbtB-domain containing protein [Aestuariivirga sp.]
MTTVKTSTTTLSVSQRVTAGAICLFLGASLVFLVGMSHISAAHNAAHDTRHSIGFPCH